MKEANFLRNKFLEFFEKRGHKIVPSSSLIPPDPSVLLTTAGMQQFKPYYLGEKSPYGKNVASCQKCFRTSDIEEVGNTTRHLTFFEMLGNFSFGGYFKEEAIKFAYDFLFEELKLPKEKMLFTIFGGDKEIPEDKESALIWKKLGISENQIKKCQRADNFWGPTGKEGPCGPTTEIHFAPNGNLAEGLEIWNLVFNEYFMDENKKLTPLKQKGVDTGMGLERLAMVCQEKPSVFETDLFFPIINEIRNWKLEIGNWKLRERSERIIADHIKGSVFLIADGVLPSNVEQGYVLRRILRRMMRYAKLLNLPKTFLIALAQKVIAIYHGAYPELKSKESEILTVIEKEEERFEKTLSQGLKNFEKISQSAIKNKTFQISGIEAFHLFDTYGFPLELTEELAKEKNLKVDSQGFQQCFLKHREISRAGAEKKFGGVGKDAGYQSAKLHTATHLLHSALRQVLGEHVKQMGSDITPERLRFDFSHFQKMTEQEIKKIEDLVNQKIKEDLVVKREEMSFEEAIKSGALAFFKEKYPERVSVYTIDDFSKEICAGPHVKKTGELGFFQIIKEESLGAGIRRIRAILK